MYLYKCPRLTRDSFRDSLRDSLRDSFRDFFRVPSAMISVIPCKVPWPHRKAPRERGDGACGRAQRIEVCGGRR